MGAELLSFVKSLELISEFPNTKPVDALLVALVLSALAAGLLRNEPNKSVLAVAVFDASRLNLKPPVDEEPKLMPAADLSSAFASFGRFGFGSSQQGH